MVEIYVREGCPYCINAKELLDKKGVSYQQIVLDPTDQQARELMRQRAEGRNTFPQIFINGQAMGGYSDIKMLDDKGELDPLLSPR